MKSSTIDNIEELLADFKGNKDLRVNLKDGGTDINIEMLSRKYRIEPSQEFFEKVDTIEGVSYQLF